VKEVLLPAGIFAVAAFIWLGWHYWVISNGPPRVTYDYRDNALLSSTSSIDRIGTAIGMQSRYWLKMLIGYPLSYNYSYNEIPVDGFASVWAWISLAGIAAAGYFSWKNFRSNPVVSYAILFYFITFALTCNIFYLIGETFAERLVFVPSLGFALLFAWIILKLTKGTTEKKIHAPAMYLLTGILLVYSIRTYSRSQDWKYQNDLFTADVENAPNSARVHDNYGLILLGNADKEKDQLASQKLKDAAYAQFSTAAAIDTLDFQAALLLAQLNLAKMNYDSAIYWGKKDIHIFRSYYKVNPNDPAIYSILGNAWIFIHKPDSAAVYFNEGLKIFPQNENFMIDIGNSYFARQDTVNALVYYQKAVDANPKSITAWDKVGNVAGMHREYERSNKAFETLLQLNPSDPKPYATMRTNYLLLGDTAKAIQYNQLYIDNGGK
jgi:Tfp pilus assembly protein PilF